MVSFLKFVQISAEFGVWKVVRRRASGVQCSLSYGSSGMKVAAVREIKFMASITHLYIFSRGGIKALGLQIGGICCYRGRLYFCGRVLFFVAFDAAVQSGG